jgi:Uma2 family endonuclease
MAMPQVLPERWLWTVEELDALPKDRRRYEVLYGELLVNPPPQAGHNWVAFEVAARLRAWCDRATGWTVLSPGGVYVSAVSWLEPDVAVYPVPGGPELSWRSLPPPRVVVEIGSPATIRADRFAKRVAYLNHGVGEVWLIDGDARRVERWSPASELPEVIESVIRWWPQPDAPPFELPLDVLFASSGPAAG